ncbi:hypothetical protein H6228_001271 [Enterococcus faecalis]|nr:hypothetical protein [Enterococcus faecalis]EGO5075830.1 hypothetical protein [Enterococcus faecalis]EHV2892745.1 hypothetical protein [Enterococcus faecalis]
MTLLSEIDYKKTKNNVRQLLKKCRSLQRMSGVQVHLQSPVLSDMPRYHSNRNNVEASMIHLFRDVSKKSMDEAKRCRKQVEAIEKTLQLLPDVSREILYYSYCAPNYYSMAKLSRTIKVYRENEFGQVEEITYSIKNIEKLKDNALIEFAEAYHYENLIVQKK